MSNYKIVITDSNGNTIDAKTILKDGLAAKKAYEVAIAKRSAAVKALDDANKDAEITKRDYHKFMIYGSHMGIKFDEVKRTRTKGKKVEA